MVLKGLKSAIPRPTARDALAVTDAVAQEAGLPPATLPRGPAAVRSGSMAEDDDLVQVNIRVRRSLGDQLADRARADGTTQKVLICRALAAAGFHVHADDCRAISAPRRRGSSTS